MNAMDKTDAVRASLPTVYLFEVWLDRNRDDECWCYRTATGSHAGFATLPEAVKAAEASVAVAGRAA